MSEPTPLSKPAPLDDTMQVDPGTPDDAAPSSPPRFVWRLLRRPRVVVSLLFLSTLVAGTVFAEQLAPYGAEENDYSAVFAGPSARHWLGTGELGRDVLSRILWGGKVTLLSVVVAIVVYGLVGIPLGVAAGYFGGWVDRVVMRLADLVFALPAAIIMLVVLAVFPGNELYAMVTMGILAGIAFARVVRSVTTTVQSSLFVRAARVGGLNDANIARRHVLPNIAGSIIVHLSLFGGAAVGLETAIGFLGVGSLKASWGTLLREASENMSIQPWLLLPSGLLVILFVLACGILGDGIGDSLAERSRPVVAKTSRQRRSVVAVAAEKAPAVPGESAKVGTTRAGLLSIRNLTVSLPIDGVDTVVVRDFSLDIEAGEVVGLLGESGCGKSVSMQAVLGLLPFGGRVVSGSVLLDGVELVGCSQKALQTVRGAKVGLVAQDPVGALDPCFTVGEQLREALSVAGVASRSERQRRTRELLQRVRLADVDRVAASYPHELSGGMAQRVGIALALSGRPRLLIADEPTTALDVTIQAEILDLFRELCSEGMAVLLVTHDWGVLAELAERAAVMHAGEIVEIATVRELLEDPRHPYSQALVGANPALAERGAKLPVIAGSVPDPRHWPQGCHFRGRCPFEIAECVGPVPLLPLRAGSAAVGANEFERLCRCRIVPTRTQRVGGQHSAPQSLSATAGAG
jgi:peptide/nickel transport system permease protein